MTQACFNSNEQILCRFTVLDLPRAGHEAKTGAVSAPVGDAGVRVILDDLLFGFSEDGGAISINFEFPADEKGIWKEGAQFGNDLRCGDEFHQEVLGARRNLAGANFRQRPPRPALPNPAEFEIIYRGCVENGVDVGSGKRLQALPQVVAGGEGLRRRSVAFAAPRGLLADEECNAMTLGREKIDEFGTEPPGREIRETAHVIQRLVGWSGSDDTVHGRSLRDCPRKRYSVE